MLLAAGGAVAARVGLAGAAGLAAHRAGAPWRRTNYAGRPVTLLGGPALAAAATASAVAGAPSGTRAAAAVVGTVSGLVGAYDDLAGARPEQARDKGLAGHLRALRAGRVSAGAVKVAGIGAAAAAAALLVEDPAAPHRPRPGHRPEPRSAPLQGPRPRPGHRPEPARGGTRAPLPPTGEGPPAPHRSQARGGTLQGAAAGPCNGAGVLPPAAGPLHRLTVVDAVLTTGLVAGTANLVNLLDLRPGRAAKAATLLAAAGLRGPAGTLVAGPLGAGLAVLPADLGERVMLGDCGANAVGALLGLRLAALPGRRARAGLLAGVVALTLASERVSFTRVIEATPGLRGLDRLGRRRA
ncbi:hypothetical protein DQ238_12130 [Geodermatophilus sp. TF02-6]|nr:hypothetical protein DQ238_12130 [Geodermatophilus sp. TF02-6]